MLLFDISNILILYQKFIINYHQLINNLLNFKKSCIIYIQTFKLLLDQQFVLFD